MGRSVYGTPIGNPFSLFKSCCPVCEAEYWRPWKARDCCKGTPEYDAWRRMIDKQVAAAEAKKMRRRGKKVFTPYSTPTPPPRAGLGMKPCPNCQGERGHVLCRLCDGDGFVPENVF